MNQYRIERVTATHYSLLQALYVNAFNLKMTKESIAQRFDTKNLGCQHIGFVAIDTKTETPAGYYGVFPIRLKVNNTTILAAQSGDTMTDSRHRMKGLFFQLANLTYEECRQQNIQFVFGQPNKHSYKGLVKLGWTEIDSIIRKDIKLKIKTIPLPKLALKWQWLNKLYLKYARLVLKKRKIKEVRSFYNTLPCNYLKVERDNNYLEYKKSPDKFFLSMNGIVFWVKLTDVFWIGDCSDYAHVGPSTIKKIKALAFWLGYNTISIHINQSVVLPRAFDGFKPYSTEPSMYLPLNADLKMHNILLTGADFDTW